MIDISYGDYSFPTPLPFVGQDEQPVFVSGKVDHSLLSINLIGQLTGCDLPALKSQKEEMVLALSSGFQELTIGNTGFNFAKPINIDFQDSDLTRILPYNVSFEVFHEKDFSQFYGISSPVDTWQYQEDTNSNTVSVTHNVSAVGEKTSDADSLTAARDFVNSRLNGFDNMSLFFTGDTSILVSKAENLNRLNSSYSVTETYILSESLAGFDKEESIVRPKCNISYDSSSTLSLRVDGTIKGGISGTAETGFFTPEQAAEFAKNSLKNTKIDFEESLYGDIFREPQTYNYDIDTGSNLISFSFSFNDPTDFRTGDTLHDFTCLLEASKDTNNVNARVQGKVFYNTTNDIFSTDSPENELRYKKVQEHFSGINHYSIAQNYFNKFCDFDLNYNKNPLYTTVENFNISTSPHNAEISYNYQFSNKVDLFSGILKNAQVTVQTQHPISVYGIQPTVDGSFSVQDLYDTLERKTVSVAGTITGENNVDSAADSIYNYISQHSGSSSFMSSDTIKTGDNTISISRTFVNE
tara:strand:+ start:1806 stop:3380 length:1575 start_codon:yes stop_codon:yes gene_type:complete